MWLTFVYYGTSCSFVKLIYTFFLNYKNTNKKKIENIKTVASLEMIVYSNTKTKKVEW